MDLTILIPTYNEEKNVSVLYKKIIDSIQNISYEVIFINDGSQDNTEKELNELYNHYKSNIKIINFSRNFGKDAAIFAGIKYASGKYTVIIDADLQQNPKYINEMYDFLEKNNNYDIITAITRKRKHLSILKRIGSYIFYKIMNILSSNKFTENASDFRMFRNNVKEAIISLKENDLFFKGIFSWIGFDTKYIEYDVEPRYSGKTKYSFINLIKYAMNGIFNYSTKPLFIILKISMIISFLCLFSLIYLFINNSSDKYNFLMILIFILINMNLFITCISSVYLSKLYSDSKNRSIYIIKSTKGIGDK